MSSRQTQPLAPWALDTIHRPFCDDRGYHLRTDESGVRWASECDCMRFRRGLRELDKLRERA